MLKATYNCCIPFFNKNQLMNLKKKAMRSGVWFKALNRIDRVLFDLTIKVVDNIRSTKLAKSMLMVTIMLENAMKGSFLIHLGEIGFPLVQRISLAAQKLGNISAVDWESDSSFATFLAVMHINNVEILGRKYS
jgi:hypothetical protein